MSKKHEMSEHEYQAYKKTHDDEHPLEEERGKIRREKANAARYRRKSKAHLKRQLREIAHSDDLDAWEEDLESEDYDYKARRELRNAHTHKQRLEGLKRHENRATPPAGVEDAQQG